MGKDSALKLYNALKSQGKYTKSFAEFQGILGDKQRSQKLYTALSNDGLYTKTFSDFSNQFGSGSETAHTTRTQTTTPKKTDFVADTINMLRTPSSQYTRPQQTQQTAPKKKWSNEVDVYSSMPDVVKQYAPTPTPLKTDSSVSMRSAATSTWNAADRAAREEYDRLHPKKEESFWERAARLMTDAEMGMGNENMEKATDMLALHYKTHDLQKLSDQAWNALGATQQKNITDEAYDELKRQYPQATEKELREAAAKVARAKSDETMYNLAVQKNMPDNAISFFARKMAEGNSVASLFTGLARQKAGTVGDLAAETEANERYGKKHKVAGTAGSVVGMASDPLTYAAGGVGGAATKGALWAGGKVLSEAAARKMSQTLGGKLLLGAVSGAANFGTFEAGGEAINQYKWGGTLDVDPETGRYVVGDFSLGKVASQMGHGLTMGGLTGAFGTWLGNVSTKAAQATTSTLGKLGVRAGELGVGLVGEGTIFATPEFISTYGDYNDVIKSVSDKNSPNYIADEKERSKYIAELKAQRGERMMDIWQDNLAMIAGFKAQHAIKSAGRTISELAASRRGKVGFVERMGRMLDGHPSLALSKEEQAELDKHGYGDLTQMVKEYKAYAQKDGDLPYNKITQLLNDKNVSEAARAKMYYYVTGHSLPMSAVIASNVIDNGDKTYTVQSLGDNGVITSRTYGNRKRADYEKARIDRQAELNGVAMAEQMFDNMDKAERLKAVCTRLAQDKGVSPETLLWLTRKDPKQMTAAEKRWIKEIEDAANEDAPQGENATVRHIKGVILDEYGVDVDKALRKAADSRTDAEKTAISAYNNELAQAVAARKNAIRQDETTDAYRRGYEADTQGMRDAYVAQMYEPSEDNAETLRGVESQITESAKYQAALERDELKQMTHKDGSIHLATLKDKDKDGNGKQVYIVDGDVVMKEDGSGVDADASSKSVIIYDPATGEKKMVSPTAVDGIESLGEVKTAEQREAEINAHMQDTIQRSKDWLEGNVANPVGMQIQLDDGRIATIEAMHEDGKSAIATLPDGTQFLVPKDVLQRIVNNGQYADYKARRDAEVGNREAEQSTESAPETATEGGQPLPEEASPKEEERREYAQGDVFDVVVDGQKMHAEIVSPKDADGRFVVNVDDGESMRTLYVTPEELAAMEYREDPSPKAEETRLATEDSSDKAFERGAQPTEEHAPTALERIPRDEKGNAQFHDVDTETAWDGLVEMSGNEETAHKVAEASLANAERKLKAAKALKEKGETPEELLRSIKENEVAVAEAQRVVDAWKAIVGEKSRREEAAKAEAERIATEKAEAERKAAEERERAEAEEKTRIEAEKKEAERIAAEKAEEEARVEAERKAEEERKTKEEERKERDENGQPFVVSSDGTTTFGEITEDTGLTAAPIKLSEGVADKKGNGYGLRHIEARHGDQIRKAGFSSVEEFVKYVASNYDKHNIKIGKKRANGVETYLIQAEDEHSNVLYVELSKDGSYWNVNSGGIFRKGYAEKKKDVGQNTEHPTSATTLQDKSFVQTDKDNGSQSADTHSDKQHPSADKGTTLAADQQTSDKEKTKKVADSEGENTLKAKIEAASADVNTEPTEAQKEAGNYKKGHVQVGTFDITIEQPEGSIRRGTDADGKKWESKMHNTYGYFRGTEGVDGDHIDVFLSNDIDGWNGRKVFVVDQYNPDGTFDEHKVMLGFNDMDEAKSDYLANYEKGWENGRRIDISSTNLEDFEKWIGSSHRKTKPFSEYSSVNKETVATDKGGKKAEKKQKKQSVFDKAKEIADKEEKKRKAEAEDDSVIGQATRAVGKKKKVNLFKYTTSKIISYPALRGVHYANGYAYASDGYILFKEKADYPKDWEGTTRDKDGNMIDGKYPDAEKEIPRLVLIPDKEVESLPSKEVLDFAIAASKKLKGEAIPVAIDGLFFNAVNLKKFLEAVASKGMDKIVYRHPMLYATNGKDEIVMMPRVNTLEGALDIADRMESAGLPKEQIDAWKAHIEAADKKMSLEDFKKAVENAKKEGVRPTEAEKPKEQPLTEAERKDAEEVAGALGYRVEWVDTMAENGTIDADKKVIRIAKDAENPLVQVLGHEVAHGVKQMDGGKFKALQKAAMEVVGEKEWNERIEKKRKLNAYAEGKLAEEVTCDIVGEALNDKDALKRLAESLRGERGILARLRDAVAKMVEYFKNRGDKEGVRRMKAADKLLAEFESALKEGVAPEQVKPEGVDRSVRESRSEKTELTAEERELRDNLVERMRKGGLDVVTDSEEMQRVIDTENERTRESRKRRSAVAEERLRVGNTIDEAMAAATHLTKEEARAMRREWERKFKEETKELYGRVLSGNFDDVTLRLIDEFIDKSTPNNPYGRPLSKRLPPRVGQKMRGGERTGSIDALFSRISESAVGKDGKALPRAERERAIEEKKKELLKKWAIATGNWHTDIADFTDQREPIGSGTDSDVYLGKDGKSVIKVSKGKPYGKRFRPDVDNVALFNSVFRNSAYTIVGYGEVDGKFVRFLKQPIVDFTSSTPLTEGERVAYMEKLGFKPINKENTAFSNGEIIASDLQKSNIVKDKQGNVRVIDADMKLHTKDFGGKFSYPDAETDTRTDGVQRFLRTAGGEVYGLVKDGRIYLDPKVATSETAVHEYTHLWGDMLRRKDSEQWSRTVKELKNSVLWEEVKESYPELKTDDEIADEVLSTFSGRRGAERLREEARRVADGEGGVFTKAKAIKTLERVKEAIARFWEGVARMFGINRYRSAEELADMAMKDLLDSKNPMKDESGMRKRGEVGDEGVKSLKGEEAMVALDNIFEDKKTENMPQKVSSLVKFMELFRKPVRTFLGEVVNVKEEVYNKIIRKKRTSISGAVLPTLENADFAIRDTDGSTLYIKRFKSENNDNVYNIAVVNKYGEVEDYVSSVHIKSDNNLRNKITKGAELLLPNARTTDGTMSRNNSTPGAKVANYSETAKPRYSRKPGESIFDYASRVSEDVDRSVRERVSARDEYEKKVKSKGFQTKEALQNSMLGLQEFMYAIDHASGNKRYIEDIPDFENPILGENRLSSVNKEEMHQVAKTQFKPLMSAVAKLSGNGKESGELYDYMFAKHGLERDAVMRQREAQKEFDKYQKANPKGTKTIGDFVASLEGKDYAGLTALTAEDGRVKSIQSQIDAIDEQMKATDDQLLLRKLGGQKKRLKVDLLNAARDAADDIRKTFENNPSHDRSDINELWSRVNEVNGNTLRKLYESGMLTKEAYNDISSMYTNYIPMRGFDQTTSADAYAYLTHGDSAFNAPIKTAKGRSSKADNPIAYMQAMAESAIMQGNRNVLVKQKMLNFVRNHPSDLASVSDVWLQYDSVADEWKPVFPDNIGANDSASVVAKKMEAFEDKMKQMAEKHPDLVQRSNEAPDIPYKVVEKGQLNEHQVLVKQNGKSYIITVNGSPRAAQAANGLTNPDTDLTGAVGKVFEGAEALNRQLSSLYTTLNPDFIGSNYVRDALYSNTMVYVKEGAKYGGSFNLNFAKYNPAEMANLYARYNKGSLDTSNETHRLFLEFMQNGGETGFVNLKQIEKRKSEIAKAIKRDGRISAAQIWGGLSDAVDFANRAVENSARFAAYVTSRKSGRSVGRSVYDAKEISVNFNRKGSGSKFMGAEGQTKAGNAAAFVSGAGRGLYIFWNAGLQGLTNFSRQIGRHPGKALTLAALLFGFGALMSYLGSNDDDDENNYFNLPKYIRRSNVCYKIGDLFVTIPLPVEYRSFYGLGELASSTLAGKEGGTTKDIAKEAVSQVSQLFPIDFAEGGGGLHALIPSAVKPIVEAETNTAWTGLPIYKDNDFNKNMPEYTKVYKTANGHLVEIARALNDATGGNKYKKGFIDINPAKMEYVLKGMLGGAFSFPDKLVKTTETIMGEREFDWRNTPFANRFVKNADERTEYKSLNEQYFKLKDEMDVVKQQLKGFEKEADAGNEKYEKALLQLEDSKDYERLELFKDYEKELKGLNDELKELRMSPDYDKAEEKELQKEIAELQRQLIDEMREIKK
jgi:hypothetical protein